MGSRFSCSGIAKRSAVIPKIAHVITVDLPRAAQLQPNDIVRFEEVTPAEASALFLERENDLQLFRVGLALRTS